MSTDKVKPCGTDYGFGSWTRKQDKLRKNLRTSDFKEDSTTPVQAVNFEDITLDAEYKNGTGRRQVSSTILVNGVAGKHYKGFYTTEDYDVNKAVTRKDAHLRHNIKMDDGTFKLSSYFKMSPSVAMKIVPLLIQWLGGPQMTWGELVSAVMTWKTLNN